MDSQPSKSYGRGQAYNVSEVGEPRKCFNCDEPGHIARDCEKPKKKQKEPKKEDMAKSFTLAVGPSHETDSATWVLDSGSSKHLVKSVDMLEDVQEEDSECILPDNQVLRITHKGSTTLQVEIDGTKQKVKLTNVYFAPKLARNLISFGELEKRGCILSYEANQKFITRNGEKIFKVQREDNILVIKTEVSGAAKTPRYPVFSIAENQEIQKPLMKLRTEFKGQKQENSRTEGASKHQVKHVICQSHGSKTLDQEHQLLETPNCDQEIVHLSESKCENFGTSQNVRNAREKDLKLVGARITSITDYKVTQNFNPETRKSQMSKPNQHTQNHRDLSLQTLSEVVGVHAVEGKECWKSQRKLTDLYSACDMTCGK